MFVLSTLFENTIMNIDERKKRNVSIKNENATGYNWRLEAVTNGKYISILKVYKVDNPSDSIL